MSESHPLIFAKPSVLARLFVTNKSLDLAVRKNGK